MKKTLSTLTVAALVLFGTQAVLAQDKTRAEVKKETAEANKAGKIPGTGVGETPAAMGTTSPKEAAATSDTTRAARKESTAAANKAGAIPGTGVGDSANKPGTPSPKEAAATSDTTRDARKKATAEANKAGEIKSGEANLPAKQK
jgi:hypothetical protein